MIRSSKSIYICVLAGLSLLSSCGSHKAAMNSAGGSKKAVEGKTTLTARQKLEFDNYFFEAQKNKLTSNKERAMENFQRALSVDPNSSAVYYELGTLAFNSSRFKVAEEYLKKAIQLQPSNKWYLLLLGDVYENQKNFDATLKVYDQLIRLDPEEPDYYLGKAAIYRFQKKPQEELKTFDAMEKQFGLINDVLEGKYKALLNLKKYDEAEALLNKHLELNPGDIKVLRILTQTYLIAGKEDKARETMKRIEIIAPNDGYVQLTNAEYYLKQGNQEQYMNYLKKAFGNPELPIDAKIPLILENYLQGKTDSLHMVEGESLAILMTQAHSTDPRAYALVADMQYQLGKLAAARESYRTSLKYKKETFAIWGQVMSIDIELRDNEALDSDSKQAMDLFPNQPASYLYNGLANLEMKKYPAALKSLKAGHALVLDNKGLESQFVQNIAEVDYRMGNFKEAFQEFDEALVLDSSNLLTLNNYAYYLSLKNLDLPKAARMSRMTVEKEPGNASYQDTYGWILFKQQKYDDAEKWIQRALTRDGASAEVLEHYGDVLLKLGRMPEALEYYQKALHAGGDTQKLNRKISEKKLSE